MDRIRVGLMPERASVAGGVLIFDDAGIPKQGDDSVGVGRQCSGTLGKVGSFQMGVTCRYAHPEAADLAPLPSPIGRGLG